MAKFGMREDVALWKIEGFKSTNDTLDLGFEIAKLANMTVETWHIEEFPTKEGNGGVGCQIYWVWTESFLVISTWPELGFTRIYMASCKPFDARNITQHLSAIMGSILQFEFISF